MRLLSIVKQFESVLWPEMSKSLFKLVADVGLLFLLFMVGLELDPIELGSRFRNSVCISAFGLLIPFGASFGVGMAIYGLLDIVVDYYLFGIYFGVAVSITALPVLARLLSELKMVQSVIVDFNLRGLVIWLLGPQQPMV